MKNDIDVYNVKFYPKLILDYIKDDKNVKKLYNNFNDFKGFECQIKERQLFKFRNELNKILTKQNISKNISVINNIEILNSNNSFTVTTGHQLNIFTGPLYFIYKIVTTIKTCNLLKEKFPQYNFVPIFWMATEDHDFEEINHININNNTYHWDKNTNDTISGKIDLDDFLSFMNKIASKDNESNLLFQFNKIYTQSHNLKEATAKIIDLLFGEYGVVVVDGNDIEMKSLFENELKNELLTNKNYDLLINTNKYLRDCKYKVQVNGRDLNLFYINDGKNKYFPINETNKRYRIERNIDNYKILELDKLVDKNQIFKDYQNLSPNVILRPLYQEKVLPNLAYIGGPAEISYWLQLKDIFDYNNITFPILLLRDSYLITNSKAEKIILKYNLNYEDIFSNKNNIIKKILNNNGKIDFNSEKHYFDKIIELSKNKALGFNANFEKSILSHLKKVGNELQKIKHKTTKQIIRNEQDVSKDVDYLLNLFFPNKIFQERYNNILSFYNKEFISKLIDKSDFQNNNIKLIKQ